MKKKPISSLLCVLALTGIATTSVFANAPDALSKGIVTQNGAIAAGATALSIGQNTIAIGSGATAAGGNMSVDQVKQQLQENQQLKQNVANLQNAISQNQSNITNLNNQIQADEKANADALNILVKSDAAEKQIAANNDAIKTNQEKYNQLSKEQAAVDADYQKQLQALNDKKAIISRLGINWSSDSINSNGKWKDNVSTWATDLQKSIDPSNTLGLPHDFYESYVTNYIQGNGIATDLKTVLDNLQPGTYSVLGDVSKTTELTQDEINIIKNDYGGNALGRNGGFDLFSNPGYISVNIYGLDMNNKIRTVQEIMGSTTEANTAANINNYESLINDVNSQYTSLMNNLKPQLQSMQEKGLLTAAEAEGYEEFYSKQYKEAATSQILKIYNGVLNKTDKSSNLAVKLLAEKQEFYEKAYNDINTMPWNNSFTISQDFNRVRQSLNIYKENITDVQNLNNKNTKELFNKLNQQIDALAKQKQDYTDQINAIDKQIKDLQNQNTSLKNSIDPNAKAQAEQALKALNEKRDALQKEKDALTTNQEALQKAIDELQKQGVLTPGKDAIAAGTDAYATGTGAITIGANSITTGDNSLSLGNNTKNGGTQAIAIGNSNTVMANNAVALGNNITIPEAYTGAVALGTDTTVGAATPATGVTIRNTAYTFAGTTPTSVVSVGSKGQERQITNVAAGQISDTSTDAVNGSQLNAVVQSINDLQINDKNALNKDVSNISDTGKNNITNIAKDAVKVVNGQNTTVTEGTDGDTKTYAVNVSNDAIKTAVQPELDNKANKDASNLTDSDVKSWTQKLGTGTVSPDSNNLITGTAVYNAIKDSDKATQTKLDGKANVGLDNITDAGRQVIQKATNVVNGTGIAVTANTTAGVKTYTVALDTATQDKLASTANTDLSNLTNNGQTVVKNLAKDAVHPELDNKANKDASNLTNSDVKNWTQKLGTGTVTSGDTNLVSGDTIYQTIKTLNANSNPLAVSYDSDAKDSITLQGAAGTKISNVADGAINPESLEAVNGRQLYAQGQDLSRQITGLDHKLTKDIRKTGANAAALAGLHPLSYDSDNKFNVAVSHGRYHGEGATALGAYYQPNENTLFGLSGTLGSSDKMYNVSASFKFGPSGNKKLKQDTNNRIKSLENEVKELKEMVSNLAKENSNLHTIIDTSKRLPFPDVPSNSWAAEAVETLHGNGIIQGYPDGEFKGDKDMSRYEYAEMLYNTAKKI